MFSKQEYISYFNEITKIENKMLNTIMDLKTLITDNDILKILDKIYRDEQKHIELENEIIKCFKDNY